MRLERFLTVDDFKRVAERRVPRMFFQYADSGAYTEGSYRANSEDFAKIRIEQRIGVDISRRTLETTMLGRKVAMPLGLAPTGAAGMQAADGEIKAARARKSSASRSRSRPFRSARSRTSPRRRRRRSGSSSMCARTAISTSG